MFGIVVCLILIFIIVSLSCPGFIPLVFGLYAALGLVYLGIQMYPELRMKMIRRRVRKKTALLRNERQKAIASDDGRQEPED